MALRLIIALFAIATALPQALAVTVDAPRLDDPAGALPVAPRAEPILPPASETQRSDAATTEMAGEYHIEFRCAPSPTNTGATVTEGQVGCPEYVLDYEDVMGSPILAVHPVRPEIVVFSALHGGTGFHTPPADTPPTEYARDDAVHQPHTTFTSKSGGGGQWQDSPFHAPDALQKQGRTIFGVDNSLAIDSAARLYIGALYAYADTNSEETRLGSVGGAAASYRYVVGLWKQTEMDEYPEYKVNNILIDTGNGGTNLADSLAFASVPATNRVVALWREQPQNGTALGNTTSDALNASGVAMYWTDPEGGAQWKHTKIGLPQCESISNPLVYGSQIILGCLPVDRQVGGDENVTGSYAMYAIETSNWSAERIATAPFDHGDVILVQRPDTDHMAAVNWHVADGKPHLSVAYATRGARWGETTEITDEVAPGSTQTLLEARVTAAAFTPLSGTIHMIYMERYEISPNQPNGQPPSADTVAAPQYFKQLVTMQYTGRVLGTTNLQMGQASRVQQGATSTGLTAAGATGAAFNDLHDSIYIWHNVDGEDREFIAFGDFGFVRFGEIVEVDYPPPVWVPIAEIPAIPLATAGASPSVAGLGAGLLAGAMVARSILAKRKTTVEVTAE